MENDVSPGFHMMSTSAVETARLAGTGLPSSAVPHLSATLASRMHDSHQVLASGSWMPLSTWRRLTLRIHP